MAGVSSTDQHFDQSLGIHLFKDNIDYTLQK